MEVVSFFSRVFGLIFVIMVELSFNFSLDPNFRVPKYTVVFRLYLVIIVQPLTN